MMRCGSALAMNLKGIVAQKLLKSMQAGCLASALCRGHDHELDDPEVDPRGAG